MSLTTHSAIFLPANQQSAPPSHSQTSLRITLFLFMFGILSDDGIFLPPPSSSSWHCHSSLRCYLSMEQQQQEKCNCRTVPCDAMPAKKLQNVMKSSNIYFVLNSCNTYIAFVDNFSLSSRVVAVFFFLFFSFRSQK